MFSFNVYSFLYFSINMCVICIIPEYYSLNKLFRISYCEYKLLLLLVLVVVLLKKTDVLFGSFIYVIRFYSADVNIVHFSLLYIGLHCICYLFLCISVYCISAWQVIGHHCCAICIVLLIF